MRIGILGWGSLLWEGGQEFDNWHEPWRPDGPTLKVEFCRVSRRRQGALTLVIDPRHGTPTRVAWCLSRREKLDDAIYDLRVREETTIENIGHCRTNRQAALPADPESEEPLIAWAIAKELGAVVWTALKSNFEEKVKNPFSVHSAVAYVKTLGPAGKLNVAEYVWRAPEFVHTPLRTALQLEPWFPKKRP